MQRKCSFWLAINKQQRTLTKIFHKTPLTNAEANEDLKNNKKPKHFWKCWHQTEESDNKSWDENGWFASKLVSERPDDYGPQKEANKDGRYGQGTVDWLAANQIKLRKGEKNQKLKWLNDYSIKHEVKNNMQGCRDGAVVRAHASPNVARVLFRDPASYLGWVCRFSTLHREVFSILDAPPRVRISLALVFIFSSWPTDWVSKEGQLVVSSKIIYQVNTLTADANVSIW